MIARHRLRHRVPSSAGRARLRHRGDGNTLAMVTVGWHASHEQLPPSTLLDAVGWAEDAGFDAAMCSDHFTPWSTAQGQSGFAWSWLGAAMERTALPFGVVNAPGDRYHPAIVAQAAATLTEMYPDRLWVALGSGEAMNEHITGAAWPDVAVRRARLRECADVMRALFAGEEVSHRGLVVVDRARLWTRPARPPALLAAAVSVESARWAGGWADGLITVVQPTDDLRRVLDAFREGAGGDGRGGGRPVYLQVHLAWAADDDTARRVAHEQWRTNVIDPPICWDLPTVAHLEAAATFVRPDDVASRILVSSDLGRHRDRLAELAALGFDGLWLHEVGPDQRRFIDAFGEHVVPTLRTVRTTAAAPAASTAPRPARG